MYVVNYYCQLDVAALHSHCDAKMDLYPLLVFELLGAP